MPGKLGISHFGLTKHLVFRLVLPHVGLLVSTFLYILVGATIYALIESPVAEIKQLDCSLHKEKFADSLWKAKDLPLEEWESLMDQYTEDVYNCGRLILDQVDNETYPKPLSSYLPRSLLFSLTTLTSIGYGDEFPATTTGRVFVMIFILVGLPLVLITVADFAKFCAEGINNFYAKLIRLKFNLKKQFWRWKLGEKNREDKTILQISEDDTDVAEFLWAHLENSEIIEVPVFVAFLLMVGYICLVSYFMSKIEKWTYLDSLYFSLISTMTIGLGDFVPRNEACFVLSVFFIVCGVILTTACIDLVGVDYLRKIHFVGRKIGRADPMIWLKRMREKRIRQMKKDAMSRLFAAVTAINKINLAPGGGSAPEEEIPVAKPIHFRAVDSSACSIRLAWELPTPIIENTNNDIQSWFTLSYRRRNPSKRMVHSQLTTIDFIRGHTYEVSSLDTFTLYEFHLTQTTKYGMSPEARTDEYTEPATVPQNVRLSRNADGEAIVVWDSPVKHKRTDKLYEVHMTDNVEKPFGEWTSISVLDSKQCIFRDLARNSTYAVCVAAQHNVGFTATVSKTFKFVQQ